MNTAVCCMYDDLEALNVDVVDVKLKNNFAIAFFDNFLVIDRSKCKTAAQERTVLAHEAGHYMSGAFYRAYSPFEVKEQAEHRAFSASVEKYLPVNEILNCYKMGMTENWEIAEYFNLEEEFVEKAEKDEEWAPGWEAIDEVFDHLYPNQQPKHFATNMTARAMFGGNEYLDGYSIYTSANGYQHIVTYGMTNLYFEKDKYGQEWNRWGYEMTMKLPVEDVQDCMWALDVLSNMARYTYTTNRFFEPYQLIGNKGQPIKLHTDTAITALLTIADTEAHGVDTVYGRTDFIQLVGITQPEYEMLSNNVPRIKEFVEKLRKKYPNLETDLNRTESIVF